jgi:predicted Rossmann fold nucleotide-binding protein DprA/Smf involved in DNA uptake
MTTFDPNTEATLLLCGRFSQQSSTPPLEPREYYRLLAWLEARGMQPADLLETHGALDVDNSDLPVSSPRLAALLARGGALALVAETWESRGLWVVGRAEDGYPTRLRRLGAHAPPLLYGAGRRDLLLEDVPALAIVGSRDAGEEALEMTRRVGRACAYSGVRIVSGGARGVDSEAAGSAVDADGISLIVLADSLARAAVSGKYRPALMAGSLLLLSPYDPNAGFNVGNAMGRNKDVYALANASLVVWTAFGSGGTWAGAVEALKRGYPPVYVWLGDDTPEGNHRLLDEGAEPFPPEPWPNLSAWLPAVDYGVSERPSDDDTSPIQGSLFS